MVPAAAMAPTSTSCRFLLPMTARRHDDLRRVATRVMLAGIVAALSWAGIAAAPGAAPPVPAAPSPAAPAPAGSTRIALQYHPLSSYTIDITFAIRNKAVDFEAPPAYQKSFTFWTDRLRGEERREVYRFLILTQEAEADGSVPFQKLLNRFMIEIKRQGQMLVPYGSLQDDMATLVWGGRFDPHGVVTEIKKIRGKENPNMDQLGLEQVDQLFPVIAAPRFLRIGEGFSDVRSMPLPSRLDVEGLEKVHMMMTRDYVLRELRGRQAVFDLKTSYAADPAAGPTVAHTTLRLAGGGTGEAVFDLAQGGFVSIKQPSTLTLDIEAPLRPLPDNPATADPGSARTHIELELDLSATQTIQQLFKKEPG
jgi:hypothetical protein